MSTEISTHTQPRGLSLQSVADAMKFSEMVANSDFAPKDFRGKAASCMLAIQCGAEIGLAPLQALQSIAVVNGRPAVYGDAALAVVKASHVCEYVTEAVDGDGDQMVATCTAQRRGYPQPTVVTFSVADAKKAGLWGKSGPWSQYSRRMLQMRARGFALRDAFPDVLKGLVTAEEAQDYPVHNVAETPRQPVEMRPKFDAVVPLKTPAPVAPEFSAVEKARLAVSRAATLERCDALRKTTAERLADGTFSQAEHDEISGLLITKAEMLIGSEVPA